MKPEKGPLLYEGKAKRAYQVVSQPEFLWLEFKDSLTAFNAQKKGGFADKGVLNKKIASLVFRHLQAQGHQTHWVQDLSDREMLCRHLKMIPLEMVVRNRLAGSTAKKFGRQEGESLKKPLVEMYYKDDALEDPFLSDEQALMLEVVEKVEDLKALKEAALSVNQSLISFFDPLGIELIDFKLEFGWSKDRQLVLGDEISPDSCRLWDRETGERLDKDRFRRDMGQVEESYALILDRAEKYWESQL